MKLEVNLDGERRRVELAKLGDEPSPIAATIDGRQVRAETAKISPGVYLILLEGRSLEVRVQALADGLLLYTGGREYRVEIMDQRSWRRSRGGKIDLAGRQQVRAPMAGKIVRVMIAEGQRVEAGQGLLVVEAMKMQNEIRSPKSGTVERLAASEGGTVNTGEVLAVIA
jgi:biotin carboxyl carrier protein